MTRATTRHLWAAAVLAPAILVACDWYEKNAVQDIAGPVPPGALIKFFNFAVSSPQVNFYADTRKMTAIISATGQEATTGVAYGGAAAGGFYMQIPAGSATFFGKIAAATDHDLAISNLSTTLEAGKRYSHYLSGIYNPTTKTADAFLVEDTFIPDIDYTVAYVRLVNAVSNAANPLVLYATKTTQPDSGVVFPVSGAVPYKGSGVFTTLAGGVYNLGVRYVDSTANKISRTGVSFLAGRIYTIGARGDITVTSTQALDNTANR